MFDWVSRFFLHCHSLLDAPLAPSLTHMAITFLEVVLEFSGSRDMMRSVTSFIIQLLWITVDNAAVVTTVQDLVTSSILTFVMAGQLISI